MSPTYTRSLSLTWTAWPAPPRPARGTHEPVLVLFLGSTIGNFERPRAIEFLQALRRIAPRPGDALLLGADWSKIANRCCAPMTTPSA